MTSIPTRPLDNVITTKGLQDRNINILDGTTVENKGKLILTSSYSESDCMSIYNNVIWVIYVGFIMVDKHTHNGTNPSCMSKATKSSCIF